jgi:hypothetical protein
MRVTACAMAASLALLACTTPFGGGSPSPSPVAHASPSPEQLPTPSPEPSPSPLITPTPSPPPGLYLVINQSEYGTLSAQTASGTVCNARGTLPNGAAVAGIRNPQTAGTDGKVTWTYPQPATAPGTGAHYVSCTGGGHSANASANFLVGA